MSELFTVFELKLPKSNAKELGAILRGANGVGVDEIFAHYGQMGKGVESLLREHATDTQEWVSDDLTVSEAISPYSCKMRGQKAVIEFMTPDTEKLIYFARVWAACFKLAKIEVKDIWAYSEDDLDEKIIIDIDADPDEEQDIDNIGFPVAIHNYKFPKSTEKKAKSALPKLSALYCSDELKESKLFGAYESLAPGASKRLKELKAEKPSWVPKGRQFKDYLQHYMAEANGEFVAVTWVFPSFDDVEVFKVDITNALSDVGVQVASFDSSTLESVGPNFEVIEE